MEDVGSEMKGREVLGKIKMKKNKQKNTPPNSTPPIENSLGDFPKGKNEGFLWTIKRS